MTTARAKRASSIRAVLFDKDGTLIDFRATWLPAYEKLVGELFAAEGAAADALLAAGGYHRASGRIDPRSVLAAGTNAEIAALWAGLVGIADVAALAERIDLGFQAHARAAGLVPVTDLAALFGRLRGRGFGLGVATNDSERALKDQLDLLGIAGLVDFAAGYDSGHGAKPDPGMVDAFCARLGVAPREVAVVGDSRHDLDMARAAGAGLAIGVLTGASPRAELAAHADHILDSVAELESLLGWPPPAAGAVDQS